MDDMSWQVVLLILGAFVGGGSLTGFVAMALTERLRKTFVAIGGAVTHEELTHNFVRRDTERAVHEDERDRHWENILDKVEKRLAEKMHTEVNSLGLKLTRENEHLQQQMNAIGKGVDMALRQSTDSDRRSLQTEGAVTTLATRLDGIEKHLDTRLKHMESLLDILTRRSIA